MSSYLMTGIINDSNGGTRFGNEVVLCGDGVILCLFYAG